MPGNGLQSSDIYYFPNLSQLSLPTQKNMVLILSSMPPKPLSVGPQQQAPLGGQGLRPEAGLRQVAEPSCPAQLLLRTALVLPTLLGISRTHTARAVLSQMPAGWLKLPWCAFPGGQGSPSRRHSCSHHKESSWTPGARSILSTGQALTQASSQALEGR